MIGPGELPIGSAGTCVRVALLALATACALLLGPVVARAAPPPLGGLTQLGGSAACVSLGGAAGCATGKALDQPSAVTLSPDGKHAYAAATGSNAVRQVIARP